MFSLLGNGLSPFHEKKRVAVAGHPLVYQQIPWLAYLPCWAAMASAIFAFTASRLKLAPFCIGKHNGHESAERSGRASSA
jgi:hypothetical protein